MHPLDGDFVGRRNAEQSGSGIGKRVRGIEGTCGRGGLSGGSAGGHYTAHQEIELGLHVIRRIEDPETVI